MEEKFRISFYIPGLGTDKEIENLLDQHDHYEKYNPKKHYEKKEYKEDYGHGERTYLHVLYEFGDTKRKRYVVAEEQISEEELSTLEKYCLCSRCEFDEWIKKMNFLFWFILYLISWIPGFLYTFVGCRCCIGCLKCGPEYAQKYYVNKAREKLY